MIGRFSVGAVIKQIFFSAIIFFSIGFQAVAQDRCGIMAYQKLKEEKNIKTESTSSFEQWMQNKLAEGKINSNSTKKTEAATYTIPVVFHIIHNGEPIGTGTNIPDAQLVSQIRVLNEDFNRLNADAADTPSEFLPTAGSIDIEFVLAKRDPEGLATNGIVRVQGTKTSWTLADSFEFKSLSNWPSEDYFNIWIINFDDPGNFIGFAQFPESSLPGLENSPADALTDGVVLNFQEVGSIDDGPFDINPSFNKGRTATHEVGHFFGLRHLWGDVSNCGTDFVDDTPTQSSPTNGCPSHPQISCSSNNMFQNYLDFSNDVCMNIFTSGQVARMEVVLENSPRRASLTTSLGATEPTPVANDLGIKEILNPGATSCGGTIAPLLSLRNFGINTVSSVQIEMKLNGVLAETKDFVLALAPLEIATVSFDNIFLAEASTHVVGFEIKQTNGGADGNPDNNFKSTTTQVPFKASVPLIQRFDIAPTDWIIQNPDLLTTWENVTAPNADPNNRAMSVDFFDYENTGAIDRLISPVLDLSATTEALLKFDVAYAQFPNNAIDELKVVALTDCNADLTSGVEIFSKSGSALATTASTANPFVPSGQSQWRAEPISLSAFAGQPNLQLVFITKNGFGNNLYLDNVFVLTGDFTDAAIKTVISPSPVVDKTQFTPTLIIQNAGAIPVTEFKMETRVNGTVVSTQQFSGQTLFTGDELEITLNAITLTDGSNQLTFTLLEPNGLPDDAPANNSIVQQVIVNSTVETIPLRQNFSLPFQNSWTIISQEAQFNWETTTTNKGTSLVYRAFDNTAVGDEAWLVTPVLDFSKIVKASLFFDLSYALSIKGMERLRILSSRNGGLTFLETQYDRQGNEFAVANRNDSWQPVNDQDWIREFVNLSELAGEKSVRLAFVATNGNGNNMYLDEVEFFNDDNPNPPVIEPPFRVYTPNFTEIKVTFNLPESENVRLQIYNTMGQLVLDNLLGNTLNQTYTIDMINQPAGIYIVRLQFVNRIESTKVFITR